MIDTTPVSLSEVWQESDLLIRQECGIKQE